MKTISLLKVTNFLYLLDAGTHTETKQRTLEDGNPKEFNPIANRQIVTCQFVSDCLV